MGEIASLRLGRWQAATLIGLQLLFAACMASVVLYRAQGWAPEVINFGWLSYRTFNIFVSILIVGYLVWGLLRRDRYVLPLLAAFSLFHAIEGVIIGFWAKAVIHLATLLVLGWAAHRGARLDEAQRTA